MIVKMKELGLVYLYVKKSSKNTMEKYGLKVNLEKAVNSL